MYNFPAALWILLAIPLLGALGLFLLSRSRRAKLRQSRMPNRWDVSSLKFRHIPVPLLKHQTYSHGSWMGSAAHMLSQPEWNREFARRTPETVKRLDNSVRAAAAQGKQQHAGMAIAALENNPVVAAYGTAWVDAHSGSIPSLPPGVPPTQASLAYHPIVLEWDIHLDPQVVRQVSSALKVLEHSQAPAAQSLRLDLARSLADSCIIAHGTLWHTLMERVLGWHSYTAVKHLSGQMHAQAWMEAYFGALQCQAPACFASVLAARSNRPLLSVFLDVKSSCATPTILALLTQGLNERGVHVWGIGSFQHRQIQQASAFPEEQRIACVSPPGVPNSDPDCPHASAVRAAPRPVLFYIVSMPGEIQRGVLSGAIPAGSDILFNASTLLQRADGSVASLPWKADTALLSALQALVQRYQLRLGMYAQESTMDAEHVRVLTETVNEWSPVFYWGWAYSGLPGMAAADIPASGGFVLPWWIKPFVHVPWR